MKKLLKDKQFFIKIILLFCVFRIFLFIPQWVGSNIISQNPGYLGPIPWANLDGVHYLLIAERGYSLYQQAFFPLFPLLINLVSKLLNISYLVSAVVIVNASLVLALFYLWKLTNFDFDKKTSFWVIIFFLSFPTSFFFTSIYTESLFLLLLLSSFYYARKRKFFLSASLAALASGTRIIGILLIPAIFLEIYYYITIKDYKDKKEYLKSFFPLIIIPLGLLAYIYYLLIKYNDPLAFIHAQPAFGAGRSGGEIVLLPQVMWRYFKILTTISISNYNFWIALLELTTFLSVIFVLYLSYKKGIRKSYILFSFLSVLLPTISGTLSSIPRYALASFVVFIFFASIKNKIISYTILFSGIILELILSALFLSGYFVS